MGTVVKSKDFFLFPAFLNSPIIKFSPETKNMLNYRSSPWHKQIQFLMPDYKKRLYVNTVFAKEKLWMPLYETSIILEIDINNNMETKFYYLPEMYKLGSICFDGVLFWVVLTDEYSVISWDCEKNTTTKYTINDIPIKMGLRTYANIACMNGLVVLFPSALKTLHFVNKDSKKIENFCSFPMDFKLLKNRLIGYSFAGYNKYKDVLLVYPASGNMLLSIETSNLKITGHKLLSIDKVCDEDLLTMYYLNGEVPIEENEDGILSLKGLCGLIPDDLEKISESENKFNRNGQRILGCIVDDIIT